MIEETESDPLLSVSSLQAALNQRAEEIAVINSVQEALSKKMDMEGIYDLVGGRIRDIFNAQVVQIASFDHDKELEYFNYNIEKGERIYPSPRLLNKLRKKLIEEGELILINENADEAIEMGPKSCCRSAWAYTERQSQRVHSSSDGDEGGSCE